MRVLTTARDLSRRKARERDGLFVAEGVRAVEELLASSLVIEGVLCGPQLLDNERGARLRAEIDRREGLHVSDVSERDFASAASTESPQGVLAIGAVPPRSLSELTGRSTLRLLVLDAVQDPGNVGTMLRTAHALGVDATIALPGTVDLWNAKVVRSAMGSLFKHHAQHESFDVLTGFLAGQEVALWAADATGARVEGVSPPQRLALVVGGEGAGLTAPVRERVSQVVSVEMRSDIESLNVAVAAGILLYELRP